MQFKKFSGQPWPRSVLPDDKDVKFIVYKNLKKKYFRF